MTSRVILVIFGLDIYSLATRYSCNCNEPNHPSFGPY